MNASRRIALVLGVTGLLCSAQARGQPCPGVTTPEVTACQMAKGRQTEMLLDRYVTAAEGRMRQSDDPEHALADFRLAQEHWKQYRQAECNAAFAYWSSGTIRTSMALDCQKSITESRILDIWRLWLTYPDGTPPPLPKPDFSDRQ